jgi:hypothetical protein
MPISPSSQLPANSNVWESKDVAYLYVMDDDAKDEYVAVLGRKKVQKQKKEIDDSPEGIFEARRLIYSTNDELTEMEQYFRSELISRLMRLESTEPWQEELIQALIAEASNNFGRS